MKFQFTCKTCGICCRYYKIIINVVDALTIFHFTGRKFNETFNFYTEKDVLLIDDKPQFFEINNKSCILGIKSDVNGCIFLDETKCSIHKFKPSVCYFYPIDYDEKSPEKFYVKKYDICKGNYSDGYTEWGNIENRYRIYSKFTEWHNDMAKFWNKYYCKTCTEKDFIIFFYESLYPIYLKEFLPLIKKDIILD